jgi:glycerol-3-phosphate dehydrogenase
VVDQVIETFFSDRIFGDCVTDRVLPGHHFQSFEEVKNFRAQIGTKAAGEITKINLLRLADTYGPAAMEILNEATVQGLSPVTLLHAEIQYCINAEMVTGMEDFFIRRTGMLYFHPDEMNQLMAEAAACFQRLLGWDNEETEHQKKMVTDAMKKASLFV